MCCGVVRQGTIDAPILVGAPNGVLYHVRSLVSQYVPYGHLAYVTGDGVAPRLAAGTLELAPP